MNCKKCGNIIYEGDVTCRVCGEPVQVNNGGVVVTPSDVQPVQQPVQPTQPVQQPIQSVQPTVLQATPEMVSQPVPQAMPQNAPVQGVTPQQVNNGVGMNGQNMGGVGVNSQPMFSTSQDMVGQPIQPTPMPGQAQPMNLPIDNVMNSMNANQQGPKKNKTFLIVVILLVAVIIGLGGFVVYKFVDSNSKSSQVDKDSKETDNKKDSDKKEDKDDDKDDNKDEDDDGIVSSGGVVELSGFKFSIPNDVQYQKDSSTMTISDGTGYMATMGVNFFSYDELLEDPSSITDELTAEGIIVTATKEKVVNDRKFICFQLNYQGQGAIFYVTSIDEFFVSFGMVMGKSSSGYQTGFEDITEIVNSATSISNFANPSDNKEVTEKYTDTVINDTEYGSVEYTLE